MALELIAILVLVAIFVAATTLGAHMGVLAIAATFIVGVFVAHESVDDLAAGFPGDLFIILAGVTFLFGIARNNGTIDWVVHAAVASVRGHLAYIPWIMFLITAVITAAGAVVPGAVAIIAPLAIGFAVRYRINPVLMGLMVINGATAGGFSPISIFGSITNGVVQRNDLDGSPLFLFAASFVFNVVLGVITFFLFGGRRLIGLRDTGDAVVDRAGNPVSLGKDGDQDEPHPASRRGSGTSTGTTAGAQTGTTMASEADDTSSDEEPTPSLNVHRVLTLVGIVFVAFGALFFELDPGFTAFAVAAVLSLVDPKGTKGAVNHVAWPTVLLVCGIVTYVSMLENMGTIDWLGDQVALIGVALVAAVLICYIGGVVSAFASTTGILGALIPLAVPFLQGGEVGAIGLITALAISSSVVDSSPFSTSGSLVVANAPADQRDFVFRRLMQWGFSMVALAPLVTWLLLVVPGWL
ncbi:MAG: hypothetical protein GEV10_31190 [Streptosporangiales bacterium]|nr:hypothetical protein [Streptosporangiales bacterium]